MSLHTERLQESIFIIASEIILRHAQEHDHHYGIISLSSVTVSRDRSYADIIVGSQYNTDTLAAFLAPLAREIHTRIARDLGLRKTPRIRFRKIKNQESKKDILLTLQELDAQYGLSQ